MEGQNQRDSVATWEMFAHRWDDGTFHTIGSLPYVRNHMFKEPIIPVLVEEVAEGDETATAWGWMGFEWGWHKADTEPTMIWSRWGQFSMCFTYGPEAEVKRDRGRIVRLRITER